MTEAHDGADAPVRVVPLDWTPLDGGYVVLPNYWLRFYRPLIGALPAMLYEQLLCYCHAGKSDASPSLSTLADALGVDRRTLIGRAKNGRHYPGAAETLRAHGLVLIDLDDEHTYTFHVRRALLPLTPDQVRTLRPALQRQHADWMTEHGPLIHKNQNTRSMGQTTPPLGHPTPPMGQTTRTITINTNQQQKETTPAEKLTSLRLLQAWDSTRRMVGAPAHNLARWRPISDDAGVLLLTCGNPVARRALAADADACAQIVASWPTHITRVEVAE